MESGDSVSEAVNWLVSFTQPDALGQLDQLPLLQELFRTLYEAVNVAPEELEMRFKGVYDSTIPHFLQVFPQIQYEPNNSLSCAKTILEFIAGALKVIDRIRSSALLKAISKFMSEYAEIFTPHVEESSREEAKNMLVDNLITVEISSNLTGFLDSYTSTYDPNWFAMVMAHLDLIETYISFWTNKWCKDDMCIEIMVSTVEYLDISSELVPCQVPEDMKQNIENINHYIESLVSLLSHWNRKDIICSNGLEIKLSRTNNIIRNIMENPKCNECMRIIAVDLTSKMCVDMYKLFEIRNKINGEYDQIKELIANCINTIEIVFNKMLDFEIGKDHAEKLKAIFDFITKHSNSNNLFDKLLALSQMDKSDTSIDDKSEQTYITRVQKLEFFISKIQYLNQDNIIHLCEVLNPYEKMNLLTLKILAEVGGNVYKTFDLITNERNEIREIFQNNFLDLEDENKNEYLKRRDDINNRATKLKHIYLSLILLACGIRPNEEVLNYLVSDERTFTARANNGLISDLDRIKTNNVTKKIQDNLMEEMNVIPDDLRRTSIILIVSIIKIGYCVKFCYKYLKSYWDKNKPIKDSEYLVKFNISRESELSEVVKSIYDLVRDSICNKKSSVSIDLETLEIYLDMFGTFFSNESDFSIQEYLNTDKKVVKLCFKDNSDNYSRLNLLIKTITKERGKVALKRLMKYFLSETNDLLRTDKQVVLYNDNIKFYKIFFQDSNVYSSIFKDPDVQRCDNCYIYSGEKYGKLFNKLFDFHEDSTGINSELFILINYMIPFGFAFYSIRERTCSASPELSTMQRYQQIITNLIRDRLYRFSLDSNIMDNIGITIKCVMNITFSKLLSIRNKYNSTNAYNESREFVVNQISFGLVLLKTLYNMVAPIYCYNSFYNGLAIYPRDKKNSRNYYPVIPQTRVFHGYSSENMPYSQRMCMIRMGPGQNFGSVFVNCVSKTNPYGISNGAKKLYDSYEKYSYCPGSTWESYDQFYTYEQFAKLFPVYHIDVYRFGNVYRQLNSIVMMQIYDTDTMRSKNSFFNIINNILNGDEMKCFVLSLYKLISTIYNDSFSHGFDPETCNSIIGNMNKFILSLPPSPIFYGKLYNFLLPAKNSNNKIFNRNSEEIEENEDRSFLIPLDEFEQLSELKYMPSDTFRNRIDYKELMPQLDNSDNIMNLLLYFQFLLDLSVLFSLADNEMRSVIGNNICNFLFLVLNVANEEYVDACRTYKQIKLRIRSSTQNDIKRKNILTERKKIMCNNIILFIYTFLFRTTNIYKKYYECDGKLNFFNHYINKIFPCSRIANANDIKTMGKYFKQLGIGRYRCNENGTEQLQVDFKFIYSVMDILLNTITNNLVQDNSISKWKTENELKNYIQKEIIYRNPMVMIYYYYHIIKHLRLMLNDSPGCLYGIENDDHLAEYLKPKYVFGLESLESTVHLLLKQNKNAKFINFLRAYRIILISVNNIQSNEIKRIKEINHVFINVLHDLIHEFCFDDEINEYSINVDRIILFTNTIAFLNEYNIDDLRSELGFEMYASELFDNIPLYLSFLLSIFKYVTELINILFIKCQNRNEFINLDIETTFNCIISTMKFFSLSLKEGVFKDYTNEHIKNVQLNYIKNITLLVEYLKNVLFGFDCTLSKELSVSAKEEEEEEEEEEEIKQIRNKRQPIEDECGNTNMGRILKYNTETIKPKTLIKIVKKMGHIIEEIILLDRSNEYENVLESYKKNISHIDSLLESYLLKEMKYYRKYSILNHPCSVDCKINSKETNENESYMPDYYDSIKNFCANMGSDKYRGLRNVGNTCYINCIVQQLYFNNSFREMIFNYYEKCKQLPDKNITKQEYGDDKTKNQGMGESEKTNTTTLMTDLKKSEEQNNITKEDTPLIILLGELFGEMKNSINGPIEMDKYFNKLYSLKLCGIKGEQYDAMEFNINLIEQLKKELVKITGTNNTNLPFHFSISSKYLLTCHHYTIPKIDDYDYIYIAPLEFIKDEDIEYMKMPKIVFDVQELLELHSEIKVSGRDKRSCPNMACEGHITDESNNLISSPICQLEKIIDPPKTLVINLGRHAGMEKDDWVYYMDIKINKILNLKPILEGTNEIHSSNSNNEEKKDENDLTCMYVLSGIVIYMGTDTFGHYISLCRESDNETRNMIDNKSGVSVVSISKLNDIVENSQWFRFNDINVSKCGHDSLFVPFDKSKFTNKEKHVFTDPDNTEEMKSTLETYANVNNSNTDAPFILIYEKVDCTVVSNYEDELKQEDNEEQKEIKNKNSNDNVNSTSAKSNIIDKDKIYSDMYKSMEKDDISFIFGSSFENLLRRIIRDYLVNITNKQITGENMANKLIDRCLLGLSEITNSLSETCDFRLIKKYILYILNDEYTPRKLEPERICDILNKLTDVLLYIFKKMDPENIAYLRQETWYGSSKFDIKKIFLLMIIATTLIIEFSSKYYPQIGELALYKLGTFRDITEDDFNESYNSKMISSTTIYSKLIQNWILTDDFRYSTTMVTILYILVSKPREELIPFLKSDMDKMTPYKSESNVNEHRKVLVCDIISRTNKLIIDLLLLVDIKKYYKYLSKSSYVNNIIITLSAFDLDVLTYNSAKFIKDFRITTIQQLELLSQLDMVNFINLHIGDNIIKFTPMCFYFRYLTDYFSDILFTLSYYAHGKSDSMIDSNEYFDSLELKYTLENILTSDNPNENIRQYCDKLEMKFSGVDTEYYEAPYAQDTEAIQIYDKEFQDRKFPRNEFMSDVLGSVLCLGYITLFFGYPQSSPTDRGIRFIYHGGYEMKHKLSYVSLFLLKKYLYSIDTSKLHTSGNYFLEIILIIYGLVYYQKFNDIRLNMGYELPTYLLSSYLPYNTSYFNYLVDFLDTHINEDGLRKYMKNQNNGILNKKHIHLVFTECVKLSLNVFNCVSYRIPNMQIIDNIKLPVYSFPNIETGYGIGIVNCIIYSKTKITYLLGIRNHAQQLLASDDEDKTELLEAILDNPYITINTDIKPVLQFLIRTIKIIILSIFNMTDIARLEDMSKFNNSVNNFVSHDIILCRTYLSGMTKLLKYEETKNYIIESELEGTHYILTLSNTLRDPTIFAPNRTIILKLCKYLIKEHMRINNINDRIIKLFYPLKLMSANNNCISRITDVNITPYTLVMRTCKCCNNIGTVRYYNLADEKKYELFMLRKILNEFNDNNQWKLIENIGKELVKEAIGFMLLGFKVTGMSDGHKINEDIFHLDTQILKLLKSFDLEENNIFTIVLNPNREKYELPIENMRQNEYNEMIKCHVLFYYNRLGNAEKASGLLCIISVIMEFQHHFDICNWIINNTLLEIEKKLQLARRNLRDGKLRDSEYIKIKHKTIYDINNFLDFVKTEGLFNFKTPNLHSEFNNENLQDLDNLVVSFFLLVLTLQLLFMVHHIVYIILTYYSVEELEDFNIKSNINIIISNTIKYYSCYMEIVQRQSLDSMVNSINKYCDGNYTVRINSDLVFSIVSDTIKCSLKILEDFNENDTRIEVLKIEHWNPMIRMDKQTRKTVLDSLSQYFSEHREETLECVKKYSANNIHELKDVLSKELTSPTECIFNHNDKDQKRGKVMYYMEKMFLILLGTEDISKLLDEKLLLSASPDILVILTTMLVPVINFKCECTILYRFYIELLEIIVKQILGRINKYTKGYMNALAKSANPNTEKYESDRKYNFQLLYSVFTIHKKLILSAISHLNILQTEEKFINTYESEVERSMTNTMVAVSEEIQHDYLPYGNVKPVGSETLLSDIFEANSEDSEDFLDKSDFITAIALFLHYNSNKFVLIQTLKSTKERCPEILERLYAALGNLEKKQVEAQAIINEEEEKEKEEEESSSSQHSELNDKNIDKYIDFYDSEDEKEEHSNKQEEPQNEK